MVKISPDSNDLHLRMFSQTKLFLSVIPIVQVMLELENFTRICLLSALTASADMSIAKV